MDGIDAQSIVVIDPRSRSVLFEKNANARRQVASTQKLLTALIVAQGGKLDSPVVINSEDSDCLPFRLNLDPGRRYTRLELLGGMLVGSANDAAHSLARDHSGSLAAFTKKMNTMACELGMTASHYTNVSGLPDVRQFSTARDMANLACAADELPIIRELVTLAAYCLDKGDGTAITFANTNRLLSDCPVCDGMKTGYTKTAGYCLIASGQRENLRRIVVMLGACKQSLWEQSRNLLEGHLLV